ncbi:MAG: YbjQ family protein [Candidatus Dormibacteraeota bacterium]|nr:YbjQ family protein [Candidatus Dormibacteraeota bacterium]
MAPEPQPHYEEQRPGIDPRWVTTAFEIRGARVARSLGVVRGVTVRSRSVFGSIGAGFQALGGGNITLFTELAEHARQEAYLIMCAHAAQMGANGIIGMRYDATEIQSGITEVLAYGTAVVFEADPDVK